MFLSGRALPALIGASAPLSICCADRHALGRDDVAALAVGVAEQRDVGAAVRVVLEPLDLGRNAVLVALEVDQAVVLLVAAALMARGDAAVVVAAGALRSASRSARDGRRPCADPALTTLTIAAAAGRSRFDFDECHRYPLRRLEVDFLARLRLT